MAPMEAYCIRQLSPLSPTTLAETATLPAFIQACPVRIPVQTPTVLTEVLS
jgi:hypothetical protein